MELPPVARQMFALYGEGRYEDALRLLEAFECSDQDDDVKVTFWRACLHAVAGRGEEASRLLWDGIGRGLWWAPEVLADPDLDSARSTPGWADLLEYGRVAAKDFMASYQATARIYPAGITPVSGTMIALHGAGADPKEYAERWQPAVPPAWALVVPEGPVPFSRVGRSWDFGRPTGDAVSQLAGLDLDFPIILSGYSQGSSFASWWAWNRLVDAAGLLLFAVSRLEFWESDTHRHVPTYIVIGDHDFGLPVAHSHLASLESAGVPNHLDLREGMGHQLPDDLEETLASAIDWFGRS